MVHTAFGEHHLFDRADERPVPELSEIRPSGATKASASNRPGARSNLLQAGDGRRGIPQKPCRFGDFLLTRGAAKECIARLSGCLGNSSDDWCLVVSPRLTAGASPAEGGRPEGVYDLNFQPLTHANTGGSGSAAVLVLAIPVVLFSERVAAFGAGPFRIPDAGLGAILVDYLLALEQRLPSLKGGELPRLVEVTKLLIAGCLTGENDSDDWASSKLAESRMQRARSIIRENLGSPHFGEADIRRALGISRSSLYRLFSRLGGVQRHLQRERLLWARTQLADPLNTKPIFRIAEELCFCDPSSFSRAFKSEFGINPGAVRAIANPDRNILSQALPAQDRRFP